MVILKLDVTVKNIGIEIKFLDWPRKNCKLFELSDYFQIPENSF